MTNIKSTKRALLSSVTALFLCFAMLLGTTFAWFTDEVTSGSNIIKSGTLKVDMEYADGTKAVESVDWTNANGAIIYDNDLWEPGYTDAKHIKISNVGTLALKYQLAIIPKGEVSKLAEVIDVYLYTTATQVKDRTDIDETMYVGTLADVISKGIVQGNLDADSDYTMTIVLKMQENANNDYQDLTIGDGFTIHLFATQYTKESDSFDENYDAHTAVFSVKEANDMLAAYKDVTLVNCIDPEGILYVPADYTGTLTLNNVTIASVMETAATTMALTENETVAESNTIDIVILGEVIIKANKDGMSAITGTALNITGNGTLTVVGNGKAGFGIGGMNTESINIENITIAYAEGGYAGKVGSDNDYYKDSPEGGAAIGSGKDGAVITLNNVTINKAIGGSKAAGIGARYHTGVTINITDSTIDYVEGGVSAAGIGGSRVSSGATEKGTTINIKGSTINAVGGVYGAGIGSGYDTHCGSKQPMCTINIEDSTITANGGNYAAGIGTGYHNAALQGEIKNSTIKAFAGNEFNKDKEGYYCAMSIGFGVVNSKCEGQQTNSYIIYNGVKLTFADAPTVDTEGLDKNTDESTKTVKIETAAQMFAFANAVNNGKSYAGYTVTLENDIDLANTPWTPIGQTGATEFKGTFDGQSHTIKNLYIDSSKQTGEYYSSGLFGWIESHGQNITIKNITVEGATVIGHHNVAVIAGYMEGDSVVENCKVVDAKLTNTHANDGACGDKTGVIAGYAAGEVTVKGCTATNCTVAGARDAGQLIGASYAVPDDSCSATNVVVSTTTGCTDEDAGKNVASELVGKKLGSKWN